MATKSKRTRPVRAGEAHADFMLRAYYMELDAELRYDLLADQMELHNNGAVADMFRKLARVEAKHAQKILSQMRWKKAPGLPAAYAWQGFEAPETVPADEPHYLMQPWHALQLALRCEKQAQRYFERIVKAKPPARVLAAAREMAAEEAEHVRLIRDWLARVPKPEPGWDRDPDPPQSS